MQIIKFHIVHLLILMIINNDINCVKYFCLDYMHLVCLGVMKRVIQYLKNGPRRCRISANQMQQISNRLESYKGKLPSEMARQPRDFKEIKTCKAREFRVFLLYSGVVVLKGIVDQQYYVHFLTLCVAMRIMLNPNSEQRNNFLDYAKKLMIYFVRKSVELYTERFCSYNVHSLIHLHEDVLHFDTDLHTISCFPFENYLQVLKKHVRQSESPITQVVKRIKELEKAGVKEFHKNIKTKYSPLKKDHSFLTVSGDIALIQGIQQNDRYYCKIIKQNRLENYFLQSCESKLVGIFYCSEGNLRFHEKILHKNDFVGKMAYFPVTGGAVLISLLSNIL